MGIDTTNYFNLEILFNELIGDIWLTMAIGLIIILIASIKYDMSWQVGSLFAIVWLMIIFSIATSALLAVYALIVLFVGGAGYFMYQRKINRG